MSDDTMTNRVGPKAATAAISAALAVRRPAFLWGPPGIGKSDLMRQICDAKNRPLIDIRLALWEPTDIKGIPFFDSVSGEMKWAPPTELPLDSNSNAVIFLDELPSAVPSVQAAAYQLVLNRCAGTYKLPDGVDIVAAGNRDGDRGVTYRMPSPLANRFIHIEMETNFDDFQSWAMANRVHPDVIGYLTYAKGDLYDFDPSASAKAFATPRSWSFVSELLYGAGQTASEETIKTLISGAVGEGMGIKFSAHRKLASSLPNPTDILTGKVTTLDEGTEVSAMYSLTVNLGYELKDFHGKNDPRFMEMVNNMINFMMENLPTEMVVMGVKSLRSVHEMDIPLSELESFEEFSNRYGELVLATVVSQ